MKQLILRLIIAILTFVTGVTCAASFRAYSLFQAAVLRAREATLRDNLVYMRKTIDQHAVDRGVHPKSLDNLVEAGYLRDIPVDPITEQRDWIVVLGNDPNTPEDTRAVIDIRSASSDESTEGIAYNEW